MSAPVIDGPADRFGACTSPAEPAWVPLEPSPAVPLTLEVDGESAILRHFNCPLPDGKIGFYQRNMIDCFRAAVASLVQVPYFDLEVLEKPMPHYGSVSVEQHRAAFHKWAFDLGYHVNYHRKAGQEWALGIAATPVPDYHHVVVLHNDRVFFNPTSGWEIPGGGILSPVTEILYSITLDPKES